MAIFPLAILCILLSYIYYRIRKSSCLPPGPWNLPVIGSLHRLDPKAPYISLTKLAQKYGPIYNIQLGLINTVVISNAKILKKLLMKDETLGRPPLHILDALFKGKGVAYSPVHEWKHQRKFVNNFLRASGAAKNSSKRKILEDQIINCAQDFIQFVKNQGQCVTLNPLEAIVHYVTGISSDLFLGKSFARDIASRKSLAQSIDEVTILAVSGGPLNFLPFLRVIPKYNKIMTSFEELVAKAHEIVDDSIRETKRNISNVDDSPSNLIETFMLQGSKYLPTELYNEEQLSSIVLDMLGASTETSVNSLVWILLYLAKYNDVQSKVRQELIDVLEDKTPQMDDLPKLPYTEATIAEVARIRTIVPLGFPHYTLNDIEIENFKIPKNTMIMPLLWALHMDQVVWNEPEEFCPERFLNDDGKFYQPESFLPFQTGKRMCVGEELSKMVIFLFISTVLQNFRIESPNISPIDLSAVCGLALMPKPQELVFIKF